MWRWWDRVLIDDALNGTKTLGPLGLQITAPVMALLGMLPLLLAALALNGLAIEGALLATLGWILVALILGGLLLLWLGGVVIAFENRTYLIQRSVEILNRATNPRESWGWL